ncbi:MAG: LptA/OstA family protein, partial [Cyanophyceae cyanobacterium]
VIRERGVRIQAPEGTYNRRDAQSSLRGGVMLQETNTGGPREEVLADLSLAQSQPTETEEEVTIVADQLDYDRTTQIARGEGNLELRQGQTTIEAPQGSYRRVEAQSIMTGGVTLREPERVLRSARLEGNHRDKIFLFEEDVIYTQMATGGGESAGGGFSSEIRQSETEVKAARLIYNSRTETSEFRDNVEFVQRGRQATATQARITPALVELSGDVEIQQIDGDWLARRLESPEAQADVSRPTLIFADRVEIDQATSDARFYDNVVIVQENRAAEGDRAVFYDGSQTFELIADGTPVLLCDRAEDAAAIAISTIEGLPGRDALDITCRGANRIQSQLITLDMANDTFSATGQSQMQFRVTDEAL